MFECPICDAEIHKENADRCPECGWQICACCHQNVGSDPKYACCNNNNCRYYAKMICPDCLRVDALSLMKFVPGAMFGMLVLLYAAMQIEVLNATVLLVSAAVIVLCGGIGRLLLGTSKSCPKCRAEVCYQRSE